MSNFHAFRTAVATQFQRMSSHPLFRVDISSDLLWSTYLSSFPPGTNLIYRERTKYDCSCCRHFIRTVGDVVAVIDGQLVSIWDITIPFPDDSTYQPVADALSRLILSRPISEPFLHYEPTAGVSESFEQIDKLAREHIEGHPIQTVRTWTHFFLNLPSQFIKPKSSISTLLSESRSQHDVFLRSLREITDDSIDTVLDLISQGSLYRGEEHRGLVEQFKSIKRQFSLLNVGEMDIFAWTAPTSGAISRIRNTVIGTLLVDLSSGVDLESAVKSFESKVAPTNYKRPSSLITKAMIEKAKSTLNDLGLISALDRRYSTLSDITINNLLFADRSTRAILSGNPFDDLIATTTDQLNPKSLEKVESIPITKFISDLLPRATSLEVMFENRHSPNLVSLISAVDPTSRPLFKWPNQFSWSYIGEVADSIKERVKQAGGNVTGDLCCRLSWSNFDDLDLHMVEKHPRQRYEIYFMNRSQTSPAGGCLDVDMNAGYNQTREPVENIYYASRSTMKEGNYHLFVHQYNARERDNVGFECQIDYLGEVHHFTYDRPLRTNEKVTVAQLNYTHKDGLKIISSLPSTQSSRSLWSLSTQTFHPVHALMLSPNHWDGYSIGNLHYFFMLSGCDNDGSARGFFNEFLHESLTPHRKVFEVLASRMKPADSPNQLSGLGFSSTQRNHVIVRVKGSFTRIVKVTF